MSSIVVEKYNLNFIVEEFGKDGYKALLSFLTAQEIEGIHVPPADAIYFRGEYGEAYEDSVRI